MFQKIADKAAAATGSWQAFMIAVLVVIVWGISGFFVGFNNTWQLVINTGTTIVTSLMIFLLQGSQNKDTERLHTKLDELIHAIDKADDNVADT